MSDEKSYLVEAVGIYPGPKGVEIKLFVISIIHASSFDKAAKKAKDPTIYELSARQIARPGLTRPDGAPMPTSYFAKRLEIMRVALLHVEGEPI